MQDLLNQWKLNAKDSYDDNLEFLKGLRSERDVDTQAAKIDREVFDKTDCLKCGNCCRTTPAIVTRPDAKRIAKHLKIPPKVFIKQYLMEDYNGELMMNGVPCIFLNDDNTCQVYEVRPTACREYPHTGQSGFYRRAKMNAQNTIVCPAAYEIVERLKKIY